jgi:hypothetical protein
VDGTATRSEGLRSLLEAQEGHRERRRKPALAMAHQANATGQRVAVRDRRHLPFFQVHLRALRAIREHAAGPRRLRAIGFYGLVCQLANEQRHVGDHQRVEASYDTLCDRARIGRSTVKTLLDILVDAGVVRIQRTSDRGTGAVSTLLHLPVQEPPWTAMTVVMAEQLAEARDDGHPLRDLGAVITLLELCAEQRGDRGGLQAEVVRADLADRAGLSIDTLDRCNSALEAAGVLQIERRRAGPRGKHLPSVYTIVEPALGVAAEQDRGSRISGPGWPQNRTGVAASQDSRSQDAATLSPETRRSNARARSPEVEEQLENLTPQTPLSRPARAARNEGEQGSPAERLCERLCATWEPVLGDGPSRAYGRQRQAWVDAASSLLDRHPADRLELALGYAPHDTVLSSRAISMPGFSAIADDLIVRANARRLHQTDSNRTSGPGPAGWPDARVALQRAIRRHGRDNSQAARTELIARNPLFAGFLEQVRWTELCEDELRYVERRYAEIWAGFQPARTTIRHQETA